MGKILLSIVLLLSLTTPALAEDAPHPCTTNPELQACVLLAEELAQNLDGTSLQQVLAASAPPISKRLDDALLKVGEWVEATEAFAVEQTPFLVTEIIWWKVLSEGYWVAFGLLFILVGTVWGSICYRRWEQIRKMPGDSGDAVRFFTFAVPIVGNFLGLLMVMINIMPMLKPIVAPRVYLIEFFRALVR